MEWVDFALVALIAIGMTIPAVRFIPRARQSLMFDRILWGATWLLAVLGVFAAPNYFTDPALNGLVVGQVPVIPALLGAAVGALVLNGVIWLMDRFGQPIEEEDFAEQVEDQDDRTGSAGPNESA